PVKKSTRFHNWRRIRERAGLPDVTCHDLRRTCASFLAISGENIAVISKVLNHTTLANTAMRKSCRPNSWRVDKGAERSSSVAGFGSLRRVSTAIAIRESALTVANEPAYSAPAIHERAVSASCGPMSAAARAPIRTQETARLISSGGTLSAAANRYCWVNAMLDPNRIVPAQNN
ncbi:MAG: hypothetical protein EHM84_08295, partial [Lysobacterales bacterium]